jgi:hypothetical protein
MPTLMPDISAGSLGAYLVAGIATLGLKPNQAIDLKGAS